MARSLRTPALWMIAASFLFAAMAACIKLAADHGVPTGQILFYRGAVAFVLIWAYLRLRNIPFRTPHWKAQTTRGVISLLSMVLFITAITLLPLATAITLNYISPLLLGALLVLVYGERAHPAMLAGMLGGLCGVVLLLRPTVEASQWMGALFALASAVTSAISALNVRNLGRLNEPPARTVAYFSLIVTLGGTPALFFTDASALDFEGAAYVISAGVFATLAQAMFSFAYQHGNTLLVSLLGYSQVVFTSLFAILIWNDRLSLLSWAGMALVVLSGAVATISVSSAKQVTAGDKR